VERCISINELTQAFKDNTITEAFGAGTAAVIAPIDTIQIDGVGYRLPAYSHENLMFRIKKRLEDIRLGRSADVHDWNFVF
jgi:branched-chain amino acid aminotransferase